MQLRLTLGLFPGSHSAALLTELLASPIFICLWCQLCFVCSFFSCCFFASPPQAGDKHYHPSCARCSRCNQMFTEGEEMYLQGKANPPVSSPRHRDACLFCLRLLFMEPPHSEHSGTRCIPDGSICVCLFFVIDLSVGCKSCNFCTHRFIL